MSWRQALGLALFLASAAVLVASAAGQRRAGVSLPRKSGADVAARTVIALMLVAFGSATAPLAAVHGLGAGA